MKLLLPKMKEVLALVNEQHSRVGDKVKLNSIAHAIIQSGVVEHIHRVASPTLDTKLLFANYAHSIDGDGHRHAIITHRQYNEQDPLGDPTYPYVRFCIAKEMIHVFDDDEEKTPPHSVVLDLLEGLVRRHAAEAINNGHWADYRAIFGAVELLIRYEVRSHFIGTFYHLKAENDEDYSKIAQAFVVPEGIAKIAFDPTYNEMIRRQRKLAGIQDYQFYEEAP